MPQTVVVTTNDSPAKRELIERQLEGIVEASDLQIIATPAGLRQRSGTAFFRALRNIRSSPNFLNRPSIINLGGGMDMAPNHVSQGSDIVPLPIYKRDFLSHSTSLHGSANDRLTTLAHSNATLQAFTAHNRNVRLAVSYGDRVYNGPTTLPQSIY